MSEGVSASSSLASSSSPSSAASSSDAAEAYLDAPLALAWWPMVRMMKSTPLLGSSLGPSARDAAERTYLATMTLPKTPGRQKLGRWKI